MFLACGYDTSYEMLSRVVDNGIHHNSLVFSQFTHDPIDECIY